MRNRVDAPPLIAVLPYGTKPGRGLGAIALNLLHWPLGAPVLAPGSTIANLGPDDHLLLYPATWIYFRSRDDVKAQLSVMVATTPTTTKTKTTAATLQLGMDCFLTT